MAKYKNIPVKEDTYVRAKLIAEASGFGERGLGALVESLVARQLPDCGHDKQLVVIQIFSAPGENLTLIKQAQRVGYYCPTCRRVYQPTLPPQKEEELLAEANAMKDTYGQSAATKKRSVRKVKMTAEQIITREG